MIGELWRREQKKRPASRQLEDFFDCLQDYGRIYTFRDPNEAGLHNLRVNECYVLDFIVGHNEIKVSALADGLGVHKSNASRITASLQDKGLIEAIADPHDKRSFILRATKQGKERHADVKSQFVGMLSSILDDFDRHEIDTAMRVLGVLTTAAQRRIVDKSE